VTPKSYLSFLSSYKNVYSGKMGDIGELAKRMNTGLDKLVEASQSVEVLRKELIEKEKHLEVASLKAEEVLKGVSIRHRPQRRLRIKFKRLRTRLRPLLTP